MLIRRHRCGCAALNFWAPPLLQTQVGEEGREGELCLRGYFSTNKVGLARVYSEGNACGGVCDDRMDRGVMCNVWGKLLKSFIECNRLL